MGCRVGCPVGCAEGCREGCPEGWQFSKSLLYQWANVLTHATLSRPEPPQLLFSSSLPVLLPTQHLYRNSTVAMPRPNSIVALLISGHQMLMENKYAESMQR